MTPGVFRGCFSLRPRPTQLRWPGMSLVWLGMREEPEKEN